MIYVEKKTLGFFASLFAVVFFKARVIRTRHVDPGDRRQMRNKPCPCGSGKLFKRCHGR